MNYLGQFSHPNLVKLIGYCLEDEHRLLVYEFMPRGSLENHLFRSIVSLTLLSIFKILFIRKRFRVFRFCFLWLQEVLIFNRYLGLFG